MAIRSLRELQNHLRTPRDRDEPRAETVRYESVVQSAAVVCGSHTTTATVTALHLGAIHARRSYEPRIRLAVFEPAAIRPDTLAG